MEWVFRGQGQVTQLQNRRSSAFPEFYVETDYSSAVFVRIHELPPSSPSFCPPPRKFNVGANKPDVKDEKVVPILQSREQILKDTRALIFHTEFRKVSPVDNNRTGFVFNGQRIGKGI